MWKILITVCVVMHLANAVPKYINQPIVCKPNSKYVGCITPCALSCANRHKKVKCQKICKVAGCACEDGFLLDDKGNCIKEHQCPKVSKPIAGTYVNQPIVCKPDAKYVGHVSSCAPSCANRHKKTSCETFYQVSGCACKRGLILDNDGNCIRKYQCPAPIKTKCEPNEELNKCANGCAIANESICGVLIPSSKLTFGRICPKICKSICECKRGFARNKEYKCVPIKQCYLVKQ
ncbi:PREDICTED: inducible metalloproteinase inhibitor protein-like [Nicrophorus vespilloides]|uniref:Inducible metalloproteinase inhibitor protein-like n=1 Tax=Nicrophorus vespilloides TaxID=110193 RepID=A0ABM1NJI9_NICVS|nr:PREDICTED: inducible metalloproteinase inhibitor protein-like [Nicrophorus vespilloides]